MIGDLDVLFSRDQVDEADRIVASMGYAPFEGIWSKAWYREHHHHLAPHVSPSEAVKIEIHTGVWIPSGPAAPILPAMMAGSRPHPALRARRPSPSFLLFHLLVDIHGNVSIGKLGQAADAAALLKLEGKEIDPGALADLAGRSGAIPFLEDSLLILSSVYGAAFLDRSCPGLVSLLPRSRPTLERAWLRRLSLTNLCGFEPTAGGISVSGIRLLHKTLLRPGSRAGRVAFLLRSLGGSVEGEEGMGRIQSRQRTSRLTQLGRAVSFPVRYAARSIGTRLRRG